MLHDALFVILVKVIHHLFFLLTCVAQILIWNVNTAIHNLANKYREKFKLPNLKIPYNNRQGFYFSIPQKDISGKLPDKFIQVCVKSVYIYIYIDAMPSLKNFLNSNIRS